MKRVKEITDYGYKVAGRSNFVIVAPHAGGDDLNTNGLARLLARRLHASLVVNRKYFKSTNKKAGGNPAQVEDFNRLSWNNKKQRYSWKNKAPAMEQFFVDIGKYCDAARKVSKEGKAVVLYMHSLKPSHVAMDIGVGLREKGGAFCFHGSARSGYSCTGGVTIPITKLKQLKNQLAPVFEDVYNMELAIGRKYPSWSRRVAVQWHKAEGRDDYAIQFEINNNLKNNIQKVRSLSGLLAKTLQQIFL
jgi:hypothetical protein